jgi:hypothetical protein
MTESCENCRFHVDDYCRRRAPIPWDFLKYYELELLRDIAWSIRSQDPEENEALNAEPTEAYNSAKWPKVDADEWCGEWEAISNRCGQAAL